MGYTPGLSEKPPFDKNGEDTDRDLDEYASERAQGPTSKGWMKDLFEKGYISPLIKEVNPTGTKMWFAQDGIDFVADLNSLGVTHVSKASFGQGPIYKKPEGPSVNTGFKYQAGLASEDNDGDEEHGNL